MPYINGDAGPEPTFGYDFDYSVWSANTQVDLVNVPFNNDYRDVVKFATRAALDTYIDGLTPLTFTQMTYTRANMPIRVDVPFNVANRYNYLRAKNPTQPVNGNDVQKNFYYFILDTRYIAPNTTELTLQLDVWQTYVYDITFGQSYVERGHIGIANTNQMNNYGRDYLTVPEGFDIGSEYMIAWNSGYRIIGVPGPNVASPAVLIVSTVDLKTDPGAVSAPKLNPATGSQFQGIPSGANYYACPMNSFPSVLDRFASAPWVSQGIVSVTIIPDISRYVSGFSWDTTDPSQLTTLDITNGYPVGSVRTVVDSNWRTLPGLLNAINSRYRSLNKLFTFPYMAIEMTSFNGSGVIAKPESIHSADVSVTEYASLAMPGAKIAFVLDMYNSNSSVVIDPETGLPTGEGLDFATYVANFPSTIVVNNMALNYLAANKNYIAWQFQNADWAQQRALGSNQAQYDVQSGAIGTANQQAQIAVNADIQNTAIQNDLAAKQAAIGAVAGVVSPPLYGAPFGGALAAASAAGGLVQGIGNAMQANVGIDAANQSLAVRNNQRFAATSAQTGQMALARDTNKSLADWAARGDYSNQIAGINAKIQDARLMQPSTSGQASGDIFQYNVPGLGVWFRYKLIDYASQAIVGEYWLRYGYAIHRFIQIPQSLMVMTKFTYWKLTESYIRSVGVPEGFKQAIRGIMEKGVTVWNDPNDIGVIDIANNSPLPGVSY